MGVILKGAFMIEVYLFDWGDTLMVDIPDAKGKMCDWDTVQAVAGAKETLDALSKMAKVYIATGAADSTECDIKKAFDRVGLSQFISGYFCKANTGFSKGTPEFINTILANLKIAPANVAMVGDSFDKDIKPAIAVGIQPFWFTKSNTVPLPDNVKVIKHLSELY